jgi:hypothetical protein
MNPESRKEILQSFDSAISQGYSMRVFLRRGGGIWDDLGLFRAVLVERA